MLPRWIYDLSGEQFLLDPFGEWVHTREVEKVEDLFESPEPQCDNIFHHLEISASLLERNSGELGLGLAQVIRGFISSAKKALGKGGLDHEGSSKTEIPAEDKGHKGKSEARRPAGRPRKSEHPRRKH